MEIKTYKNAFEIPEKYLFSLVDAEIECWGSKPFDEFMICSDEKCRMMFSIEDVYGNISNYRSRLENKEFYCNCGCKSELFYKPNEFLDLIKEYIKKQVSIVLLIEKDNVEGFGVLTKTTIGGLINYEFDTRPSSYDKKESLYELSNKIFGIDDASNMEVIVLHQIFVSEFFRGGGNGKKLLDALLKLNPDKNIPFVLETRFDSHFYSISRSMGFQNILSDKYGYIIQYNKQHQFINLENINKLFNQVSSNFEFYKKEALEILNQNPIFGGRKSYI